MSGSKAGWAIHKAAGRGPPHTYHRQTRQCATALQRRWRGRTVPRGRPQGRMRARGTLESRLKAELPETCSSSCRSCYRSRSRAWHSERKTAHTPTLNERGSRAGRTAPRRREAQALTRAWRTSGLSTAGRRRTRRRRKLPRGYSPTRSCKEAADPTAAFHKSHLAGRREHPAQESQSRLARSYARASWLCSRNLEPGYLDEVT